MKTTKPAPWAAKRASKRIGTGTLRKTQKCAGINPEIERQKLIEKGLRERAEKKAAREGRHGK